VNQNYRRSLLASGLLFCLLQIAAPTLGQTPSSSKSAASNGVTKTRKSRPPRTLVPKEHHEWGRFAEGASRRVRVVTEYFKNDQIVRSSTAETTVILRHADEEEAVLEICTAFDRLGIARVDKGVPRVDTLTYNGPFSGRKVKVQRKGSRIIRIGDEKFETEVRLITMGDSDKKWVSEVCYSATVAPYVLWRKNQAGTADKAINTTTVDVVALGMPFSLQRASAETPEILTTSHLRTVSQGAEGKTVSFEIRSEKIPGGIVFLSSKKLDLAGRIIQRTTVQLIDYGGVESIAGSTRSGRNQRRAAGRRRSANRDRAPR